MKLEIIKNVGEDILSFLQKWCPKHPELHDGQILNWQHGYNIGCYIDNRVVGFMTILPQKFTMGHITKDVGWGATINLDMSINGALRWMISRQMMNFAKQNDLIYSAVGIVPEIENPYRNYGLDIKDDSCYMYMRVFNTKPVGEFLGLPRWKRPFLKSFNWFLGDSRPFVNGKIRQIGKFRSEWDRIWRLYLPLLHGKRTAEYLNYKISQPGKKYLCYTHQTADEIDGYIILRYAERGLELAKICDLVGDTYARQNLLWKAVNWAKSCGADGIIGLSSTDDCYPRAGLWVRKRYKIATTIKEKMHITFFDADLDNLW